MTKKTLFIVAAFALALAMTGSIGLHPSIALAGPCNPQQQQC